ncbi:MAG: RDD family protein, partial [Mycobacterium sp.]
MTAVIDDTETTPAAEEMPANALAPWWARAAAFVIDVLPGVAVVVTMALTALAVPLRGVWWWLCVVVGGLAIVFTAGNRALLPTITGWSLGRAVFGIAVERDNGRAIGSVGPWRLLIRDLAHVLDTASVLVGWLWPLWDGRRRTFADMLVRTEVRRVELARLPRNLRRLTTMIFLTAAMVCAVGAAVSYLVVYRHDRAIDQARAQIASQGPKIVEQMLTYDPESLKDDFAHAQSLATDKYREQLVVQQQEVQNKAELVANQYWVANSSVISATPDRATMLLLLQGQRGEPAKEDQRGEPAKKDQRGEPTKDGQQDQPDKVRFISATVR